jgi:hypothetical protein
LFSFLGTLSLVPELFIWQHNEQWTNEIYIYNNAQILERIWKSTLNINVHKIRP